MFKKVHIIAGIVIALVVIAALVGLKSKNTVPGATTKVRIGSHEYAVEVADTLLKQAQGLSGRQVLAQGTGMLFIFRTASTQNFWMKDMNFPIDIIWINDNKVIGFAENAPTPKNTIPTFTSNGLVDKVLEVPAGTVARDGLNAGDSVTVFHPHT